MAVPRVSCALGSSGCPAAVARCRTAPLNRMERTKPADGTMTLTPSRSMCLGAQWSEARSEASLMSRTANWLAPR
ncbi:hypothetical protein E2C01_054945 [Portunus trituberculatus]|uniref:Uncharacterized protein n=1 Tax=Portunus trituberculatus TaxID=210409 RepID=A0A5B7GU01_PORTR|nr:hypothetical protein [Portunus trituberculatus]